MERSIFECSNEAQYISSEDVERAVLIRISPYENRYFRVYVFGANKANEPFDYPEGSYYSPTSSAIESGKFKVSVPLAKELLEQFPANANISFARVQLLTYDSNRRYIGAYERLITIQLAHEEPKGVKGFRYTIEAYSSNEVARKFVQATGCFLSGVTGIKANLGGTDDDPSGDLVSGDGDPISYPTDIYIQFGDENAHYRNTSGTALRRYSRKSASCRARGASPREMPVSATVINQRGLRRYQHPYFRRQMVDPVESVTVYPWWRPTVTITSVERTRADDNYDTITVTAAHTQTGQVNGRPMDEYAEAYDDIGIENPRVTLQYRKKGSTAAYSQPVDFNSSGQATAQGIEKDSSYELMVTAYDYIGDTATATTVVPTRQCDFAMMAGRVCVGGLPDTVLPSPSFHSRGKSYFDDTVMIKVGNSYQTLADYIRSIT